MNLDFLGLFEGGEHVKAYRTWLTQLIHTTEESTRLFPHKHFYLGERRLQLDLDSVRLASNLE
jgi:hypothetical protein